MRPRPHHVGGAAAGRGLPNHLFIVFNPRIQRGCDLHQRRLSPRRRSVRKRGGKQRNAAEHQRVTGELKRREKQITRSKDGEEAGRMEVSWRAVDMLEGWRGSVIRGHLCGLQRQSSAHSGAMQFTSMKNRCGPGME